MNIKSISQNVTPLDLKPVKPKKEEAKLEASGERDTNLGGQGEEGTPQRRMNDEEFAEAIENLKNLQGVKENNLQIRVADSGDMKIIFIEDISGKVIRRIPELDLWTITKDKDSNKGRLLDKAM